MASSAAQIQLGGWGAVGMFVLSLTGYVVQTQFTEHLQTDLGYRQPYFIFYVAHSFFSIIFPIHLYIVSTLQRRKPSAYVSGLRLALAQHLNSTRQGITNHEPFPMAKFVRLILLLTAGVTVPALLWYTSVSLTPVSDVTAILNTNAVWAYGLSVLLGGAQWQLSRLVSVVVAIAGVMMIVYGGTQDASTTPSSSASASPTWSSKALLGDLLTLIASFAYSLYQVLYKKYAALPIRDDTETPTYQAILEEDEEGEEITGPDPSHTDGGFDEEAIYPTFGLYPNFLTSCIGVSTLLILWTAVPILHWTGIEPFQAPPTSEAWFNLIALSLCGVSYNAGFMVLLSLWGPTLATVGNLLTIVLVLISDTLFGHAKDTLTAWSLLGSGFIVSAFGVLVGEAFKEERRRKSEAERVD